MDDVANSLENLIHKATSSKNLVPNDPAILEVINLLEREPYYAHVATRLIALKIQSPEELEALQTLTLLDSCMKRCGVGFHSEIGKFRFLNEMIKLVSPKYLGSRTPLSVRQRVLHLMHSWTQEYPRELKIKEAYDMLKKQGVIKDETVFANPQANVPVIPSRPKNSIFEDEERSRLLQKLLQSKNPDDLQAANRLIKSMVKEDERRVEINTRRISELESVHNNARLLMEMLDSYRPGQSSEEELELIKELHQSCERLRPNVFRLASETQDNEQMLNEVLSASDELGQVFDKYAAVIVRGEISRPTNKNTSLLDLSSPSEETLPPVSSSLLGLRTDSSEPKASIPSAEVKSDIEVLGDIFGALSAPGASAPAVSILQPMAVQQQLSIKQASAPEVPEKPSKQKALEDLDVLSETLLKQNLPSTCKVGSQFSKPTSKVPMNLLSRSQEKDQLSSMKSENASFPGLDIASGGSEKSTTNLDLDFLIGGSVKSKANQSATVPNSSDLLNGDDSMVDLSEETDLKPIPVTSSAVPASTSVNADSLSSLSLDSSAKVAVSDNASSVKEETKNSQSTDDRRVEIKPLTDIFVSVDSIKPGSIPPLPVLEEKNGVSVILHFAKDTPRPDVSVIVVTTISKNTSPINSYVFQAVVPKICKCRLLPPSGSDLPAHNPFLPPSAITQVMLIANPNQDPVSLKFMVSYTMEDEMFTEMGEVEKLPIVT